MATASRGSMGLAGGGMVGQIDRDKALQTLDVVVAVALEKEGKTEEAIKYYRQAIERGPESARLRYSLGLVLMRVSRIFDALTELKESTKIDALQSDSYAAMATCYSTIGQAPWEAVCHRAYLELQAADDKANTARARLRELEALGTAVPVKEFLMAARQDFEERVRGVIDKSVGEKWGKMPVDLQAKLEKYVSTGLTKTWAFPHFAIAGDFCEKGKFWVAIAHLLFGLQQDPNSQAAIVMLASCYAEVRDYEQTVRILDLVELAKVEAEVEQHVRDQYNYLRGFVKSEGK